MLLKFSECIGVALLVLSRRVVVMLCVFGLAACASRPINQQIAQIDPTTGYRPNLMVPKRENNDPNTLFVLSFSGGGTRAAAFSYGVLEELMRTPVTVNGEQRRLFDEVDAITGVSGGSVTALSYALYGDQLFEEYEERFLKRNVQSALLWRTFNPFNWGKLLSSNYGRSELAAEYYDEILFENATYADLLDSPGPVAIAVGTDMTIGSRFAFYQDDFDLICSDLESVNLSRAAATSSAVPVVLSPVTFNNYGGTCGYQYPAWVEDILASEVDERPAGRALERYQDMAALHDGANRPYLHLVDGGVSDNIGVRGVMDVLEAAFISEEFYRERDFDLIDKIVVIVSDAHSVEARDWEAKESPPVFVILINRSLAIATRGDMIKCTRKFQA